MRVIKRVHINKICYAILEGKKGGHPPHPPFFLYYFYSLIIQERRAEYLFSLLCPKVVSALIGAFFVAKQR
jgi:hypothetical protein